MNLIRDALMFVIVCIYLGGCNYCGVGEAERSAVAYSRLHWGDRVTGVDCVGGSVPDSDDDGYVSCTVFFADAEPEPIECATQNAPCSPEGCRLATGKGGKHGR